MNSGLSFLTFLLALLFSFPCLGQGNDNAPARPLPLGTAIDAPYDVKFLDTMGEHHKIGIRMMQMAVDKAVNRQVKAIAQKMMDEQKRDLPEFQALRNRIGGGRIPPAVDTNFPGMASMDQEVAKLAAASGAAFDRLFLQTMILHHGGAVEMADDAMRNARDADVRVKAEQIRDLQRREIQDMEVILAKMK